MDHSGARYFRAKSIAHADPDRFADTGLCSDSQPVSYCDSEGADPYQSEPNTQPHSESDSHTISNAIISRPEYHTNAYADASVLVAVLTPQRLKFSSAF
jgi:hypothetical protein